MPRVGTYVWVDAHTISKHCPQYGFLSEIMSRKDDLYHIPKQHSLAFLNSILGYEEFKYRSNPQTNLNSSNKFLTQSNAKHMENSRESKIDYDCGTTTDSDHTLPLFQFDDEHEWAGTKPNALYIPPNKCKHNAIILGYSITYQKLNKLYHDRYKFSYTFDECFKIVFDITAIRT